ncbi:MAG TPA: hypothetical protein VM686_10600 [Polyangiaceae bacterium]|nr:hypothetical protein [Polyangiaceae bacterium]
MSCSRTTTAPAQSPETTSPEQEPEQAPAAFEPGESALTDSFARGEFENVVSACQSLQADATSNARALCAGLAPASLYALNRDGEALMLVAGTCGHMSPASPQSDARASLIALVMLGLAEASSHGHFQRGAPERAELLSSWLEACQVSEGDVRNAVDKMTRPE